MRLFPSGGDYGSNQGCKPYPFAQCEHHTNGTHYKPCPADIYPTDKCSTQCEAGKKFLNTLEINEMFIIIFTYQGKPKVTFKVCKKVPVI